MERSTGVVPHRQVRAVIDGDSGAEDDGDRRMELGEAAQSPELGCDAMGVLAAQFDVEYLERDFAVESVLSGAVDDGGARVRSRRRW